MALACTLPADSERSISHWTPREGAAEAMKRGIVETISERHVGRFYHHVDLKPHRSRYWLNRAPEEPPMRKWPMSRWPSHSNGRMGVNLSVSQGYEIFAKLY